MTVMIAHIGSVIDIKIVDLHVARGIECEKHKALLALDQREPVFSRAMEGIQLVPVGVGGQNRQLYPQILAAAPQEIAGFTMIPIQQIGIPIRIGKSQYRFALLRFYGYDRVSAGAGASEIQDEVRFVSAFFILQRIGSLRLDPDGAFRILHALRSAHPILRR